MARRRRALTLEGGEGVILIIPLLFLGVFFYFPLVSIRVEGITDEEGRLTLQNLLAVVGDPYTVRIILFTLEQALLSTVCSILLGLPGAFLMARYEFRGKSIIKALTTVPFVLPSIIVVLGFVIFFGNNGVLNRGLMALFGIEDPPLRILYSMGAIILAHTFYNFPVCIRLVSAVWSRTNPHTERAALSLGARGMRLFRWAILPQIMPGILAAAALIFVFCYTSFAVILVLGGGPEFSTIEVEIYRLAKTNLDLNGASALAIWESLITIGSMYLYIRLQHRASIADRLELVGERKPLSSLLKSPWGSAVFLYILIICVVIIAPMLAAVHYSFLKRSSHAADLTYTLKWFRFIFSGAREGAVAVSQLSAIGNSLFFGMITVGLSLPVGTVIAYVTSRAPGEIQVIARREGRGLFGHAGSPRRGIGRLFEAGAMMPLGISTIMLGLGYIRAYQILPGDLTGRWYAIAIAHTVIAYPFVIRSTSAIFRRISPRMIHAALSLGANRWRTFWRIELPMIKSGLVAGATFAFAISIGEINATLMLYNPDFTTMPVAIYRLISSYNFFAACALGTVLMVICFLVFLTIDKMGFEVT
jgi:thiamine transport system permease protein